MAYPTAYLLTIEVLAMHRTNSNYRLIFSRNC